MDYNAKEYDERYDLRPNANTGLVEFNSKMKEDLKNKIDAFFYKKLGKKIKLTKTKTKFSILSKEINKNQSEVKISPSHLRNLYFDPAGKLRNKRMLYAIDSYLIKFLGSEQKDIEIIASEDRPELHSILLANLLKLTKNSIIEPSLTIFDEKDYLNKLLFKCRDIMFVGRDKEMELLTSFRKCEKKFSWWIIFGQAGIGKSKLALTFCETLNKDDINAGFYETKCLKQFDWQKWNPEKDTFIVLDYARTYYREIAEVIETLEQRSKNFRHNVRILLLERDINADWWHYYTKLIKLERISIWSPPIELAAPKDDEILCIFNAVLEDGKQHVLNKEKLLSWFELIDKYKRPLYAILAGLIYTGNHKIENKIELLQLQFEREDILLDTFCKNNNVSSDILDKHKYLVALSTVIKGLSDLQLKNAFKKEFIWLPNEVELSNDLYGVLSEVHTDANGFCYDFIEPDIIGELFVLNQLFTRNKNPFLNDRILTELMSLATQISKEQTENFLLNILRDFPERHEQVNNLLSFYYVNSFANTSCVPLRRFIDFCFENNYLETVDSWFFRLKNHVKENYNIPDESDLIRIVDLFSDVVTPIFKRGVSRQDYDGLGYYFYEVETLYLYDKLNQQVLFVYLKCLLLLIKFCCSNSHLDEAIYYNDKLKNIELIWIFSRNRRMPIIHQDWIDFLAKRSNRLIHRLKKGLPYIEPTFFSADFSK